MPEPKAKKNTIEFWGYTMPVLLILVNGLIVVWNTFTVVYNTFAAVWATIKDLAAPIWAVISPAIDWVKSTVWPLAQSAYTTAKGAYDYVDSIFKQVNAYVNKFYNSIFGEVFKVWNSIASIEQKVVTLIATFDKPLATAINKGFTSFRAETIGRVENAYKYAKSELKKVHDQTLGRVKPWIDLMGTTIHTVEATLGQFATVMNKITEGSGAIRDDVIRQTTRRYGQTMWNEMFGYPVRETSVPPDPSEIEVSVFPDLEKDIETLDAGPDGDWGDVYTNLSEWIKYVDGEGDHPEFGIDKSTLSDDDQKYLDVFENAAVERFPEPPPEIEEKPEDTAPVAPKTPDTTIPSFEIPLYEPDESPPEDPGTDVYEGNIYPGD